MPEAAILNSVRLLNDLPEHGLVKGQIGRLVDRLGGDAWRVEFGGDGEGEFAAVALHSSQFVVVQADRYYA